MTQVQRRLSQILTIVKTDGVGTLLQKTIRWFRRKGGAHVASLSPLPTLLPSHTAYRQWQAQYETPASPVRLAKPGSFVPLISVLMPVYETPPEHLKAAILSVLNQTYGNWELCIANASSRNPQLKACLRDFVKQDARIRIVELAENLGISANTNQTLKMARGEFIALLDHDDTLATDALAEMVCRLQVQPDLDMLYSDHDLLSADGSQRSEPLFKPGWSPEILLSANFITHLTVLRTALVREINGFDPAFDGAQDWDLFLRVVEKTQRIAHIPRILYHWRTTPGSTAGSIWNKPLAPLAQLSAIETHLARLGLAQPRAFFDRSGFIRVAWVWPPQRVSIIIPSRGLPDFLRSALLSLLEKTDYQPYEIILVNTGDLSRTERAFLQQLGLRRRLVVIDDPRPFNYSAANNRGAAAAQGSVLVFLNNDIEITHPDWLSELAMWASRPQIGAVGAMLLYPDGALQHAGVILGLTGFAGHLFAHQHPGQWSMLGPAEWYRNCLAVTGACLALRRETFIRVGGFDESFKICGSDVDLCLKVHRAGLHNLINPFARLIHHESSTLSGSSIPANDYHASYQSYLPDLQAGDPYFNPNLSLWHTSPTLRGPQEQTPLEFVEQFMKTLRSNTPSVTQSELAAGDEGPRKGLSKS